MFSPLADCKKLDTHGKTGGRQQYRPREVTQGKAVSLAWRMAGNCSAENPAYRMYAASGCVALCLKTDTDLFLCLVTLTFYLWPQNRCFHDSSWNISMPSSVILAASDLWDLVLRNKRTDRQTNARDNPTRRLPWSWVIRKSCETKSIKLDELKRKHFRMSF